MTTYKFAASSRFHGDANAVVAEFERIRAEYGSLQPEITVELATEDDSPLHPHFPWDDAAAAHAHRLDIARRLIRAVIPVTPRGEDEPRQYVYTERDYVPLAGITANPGRYMQALAAARRDLEAAQRRVDDLLNAAKTTRGKKGDVANIMLAIEALHTANEAIHALH